MMHGGPHSWITPRSNAELQPGGCLQDEGPAGRSLPTPAAHGRAGSALFKAAAATRRTPVLTIRP